MYSAVEDRTVHFHMLHRKDHAPVEQHIVRKDTGKDVAKEDIRKAFAVSKDTAVILEPEDLEKLVPPESRDIKSVASSRPRCSAISGTTGPTISVPMRMRTATSRLRRRWSARTSSASRDGSCARSAMSAH